MHTPLSNAIANYTGILRDEEIRTAINQDILLTKSSTDLNRVRQASYELRLSDQVEYLVLQDASGGSTAKYERPANGIGDILRIEPGQTVKAVVAEVFNLPNDVVAHVIPVGNLYKIGLSPETTFADPGYEGTFYIILSNYSQRVVGLQVGQPLARVEFVRLARATQRPHPGETHRTEPPIWPRRVDRLSKEQLKAKGIESLLATLDEADPPHCEHAYIARELRAETATKPSSVAIEALATRLTVLEDRIARLTALETHVHSIRITAVAVISILVALAVFYLSPTWWPLLPEPLRNAIPEGIAKGLGTFIGGLVAALLMFLYTKIIRRKP